MQITKNSQQDQNLDQLKLYIYTCLISADNDEYGLSEDDKQEIIERHKLGSTWEYTLEPIKDKKKREALIQFFEGEEDND